MNPTGESVRYPFHGTCDCCAEGDQPLTPVDATTNDCAWICAKCVDQHEQALDAAAKAVEAAFPASIVSLDEYRAILVIGVKAYCEWPGDIDGDV